MSDTDSDYSEHRGTLDALRQIPEPPDLTIVCANHHFHIHKSIIVEASTWFDRACREGRWQEGARDTIELKAASTVRLSSTSAADDDGDNVEDEDEDFSCDHPETIHMMLDYIYRGDFDKKNRLHGHCRHWDEEGVRHVEYDWTLRGACLSTAMSDYYQYSWHLRALHYSIDTKVLYPLRHEFHSELAYLARLAAVALKYDVAGLKVLVEERFECTCKEPPQNYTIEDIATTIRVLGNTVLSFSDPLLKHTMNVVVARQEFIEHPSIHAAVEEFDGLVWAWFESSTTHRRPKKAIFPRSES